MVIIIRENKERKRTKNLLVLNLLFLVKNAKLNAKTTYRLVAGRCTGCRAGRIGDGYCGWWIGRRRGGDSDRY